MNDTLIIRPAHIDDAEALCAILNAIIQRGGTTAFQKRLSVEEFIPMYLQNPATLSCFVAHLPDGTQLGFQHVDVNPKLPDNWGDIASFAKIDSPVRGVGSALFERTLAVAKKQNLTAINAKIRADNVPGLAYYSKMGFVDYAVEKAVPLLDGTPVDRIFKKYVLNQTQEVAPLN